MCICRCYEIRLFTPNVAAAQLSLQQQLFDAAGKGDAAAIGSLLSAGADPAVGPADDGITPLMAAAESGSEEAVTVLLEAGAPWQAQDKEGYTAGEYATGNKAVLQLLLDWAVRAEMILGCISHREKQGKGPVNDEYLKSKIEYRDGKLMDAENEAVMMEWERQLMERHAAIICQSVSTFPARKTAQMHHPSCLGCFTQILCPCDCFWLGC